MAALNEESVEKKLQNVTNTQDSIQTLSLWLIHHKAHHKKIVRLWYNVLRKAKMPQRLTLFYLCNDVVQHSRKKAVVYLESFKGILKLAVAYVRDPSIRQSVLRILTIWGERNVFKPAYIEELRATLNSDKESSAKEKTVTKPATKPASKTSTKPAEEPSKPKIEVDQKILAEYKPQKVLDMMTNFKRFEADVDSRAKQLSHLRLDASNIEAVKQLKDRSHGNEFKKQFEDSCTKLENFAASFEKKVSDRTALITSLEEGELFYQAQFGEAKIVANAYKIFGTKLNNLKKKLDELKKTLPSPPSPIPSPTPDAPSPGSTPTNEPDIETVDMEMSDEEPTDRTQDSRMDNKADRKRQDSTRTTKSIPQPIPSVTEIRMKIKAKQANMKDSGIKTRSVAFTLPEKTPSTSKIPIDPSDNLEARIANMLPDLPLGQGKEKKSTPEKDSSKWNGSKQNTPSKTSGRGERSGTQGHFPQSTTAVVPEDGSATPLKDEGSSTPVQDETPEAPPASNPIDFLTKLISQTKKTNPHSSHFLQNLGFLATTMKSKPETNSLSKHSPEEAENDKAPVPPQSWSAWKAKQTQENSPDAVNGQDGGSPFPIQPPTVPPLPSAPTPAIVGAYGSSPTIPIPKPINPTIMPVAPPSPNIPGIPDISVPPPWLPLGQPPQPPLITEPPSPAVLPPPIPPPSFGGIPMPVPDYLPQSSIEDASSVDNEPWDLAADQSSPLGAPKGILRNRNSALREVQLVPLTDDTITSVSSIPTVSAARSHSSSGSSSQPTSPISGPKPPPHPPTSVVTPGRRTSVTEDQREFIEKLKRKTSQTPGSTEHDSGPPASKSQIFTRDPSRPNLTTIVLTGEAENQKQSNSTTQETPSDEPVGAPISTIDRIGTVDRSQNLTRHNEHSLESRERYDDLAHRGYDYRHRANPYGENPAFYLDRRLPPPPPDPYRDPYYLPRDPYGQPRPPKRPYPDPYYDRGRPYYPPRY